MIFCNEHYKKLLGDVIGVLDFSECSVVTFTSAVVTIVAFITLIVVVAKIITELNLVMDFVMEREP